MCVQISIYSGGGGSTTGPSVVPNFQLINQGGPNNGGDAGSYTFNSNVFNYSNTANPNYQGLSWLPATPGTGGVVTKYNIYRNGSLYDFVATPLIITGYISGSTFTVSSVTGGSSSNSISDGLLLPGALLQSAASGFQSGTTIVLYTTANTGGGGAGTYSVNLSQTVGNSGAHATFTCWAYNDTAATNSIPVQYNAAATVYAYAVTAVDASSNESTKAYPTVWCYRGISYNINSMDFSTATWNATNTTGSPTPGPYDVEVTFPAGANIFIDAMGNGGDGHGNQTLFDDLEIGAFLNGHFVMDLNFTNGSSGTNNSLFFEPQTRCYGDPYPAGSGSVDTQAGIGITMSDYGTIAIGSWNTIAIPMNVLPWGTTVFTGYITANTSGSFFPYGAVLTVLSIISKTSVGLCSGYRISDAGHLTPANTYILAPTGGAASTFTTGTYNITSPNITTSSNVGSSGSPVTFTATCTGFYKFGIGIGAAGPISPSPVCYVNNFGFTTT